MNTPHLTRTGMSLRVALRNAALAVAAGSWLAAGTALAAPANDDFANAIDLTGVGTDQTGNATAGTQTGTNNIDATFQAGEPQCGYPETVNTVWFKWTCPADGNLTVSTLGSRDTAPTPGEWDAVLGIYSGSAVNALTPLGTTPQDIVLEESMTLAVTAGTTYSIQLGGYANILASDIHLSWTLVPTVYLADILTFGPGAIVGAVAANAATINWTVPYTNPATLAPTFTLSPGATCTVAGLPVHSGDTVNLTNPVEYTVTAAGASPVVNVYTVTVTVTPNESALTWNIAGDGNWDFLTPNWLGQTSHTTQPFSNALNVIFNNTAGGTINISPGVMPLSTTVSDGSYTFNGGPIAGLGPLTKSGAGTLTLAGTNSYSGNTVVNAGTLAVNGNGAIAGSSNFAVAGGATLLLSGTSGAYKWPASAATLTGAGTVSVPLGSGSNVGCNFDMSAFTGILDISHGMMALNPYYSPHFVSPANGRIRVENNTTLYLGWTGFTLNTTVELNGGTDNGEGYGVLRGDNATLNGAVILGTNSTLGCAGGTFTVNAIIGDGGNGFGFTQVQSGTVVLNATNTYMGSTIVNSGATLQCNTPGALGNGGPLSINSGGKAKLNYTGDHVVAALTIAGVVMPPGVYGSSSSSAPVANQDDVHFVSTGTGTLTVTDYSTWMAQFTTLTNAADKLPTADPDHDGMTNLQEYAFGLDPSSSTSVNPISAPLNPLTGNFQYTRHATPAASKLTYTVLTSTNLVDWTAGAATETGFTTAGDVETVTVHVTATPVRGTLFVRVAASPAP